MKNMNLDLTWQHTTAVPFRVIEVMNVAAHNVGASVCIPLIVYTCGPGAPLQHWGTEWNRYTLLCKHTSRVCICACVCVCLKTQEANQTPTYHSSSPHEETADLPTPLPHSSLSLHLLSILCNLPHLSSPSLVFTCFFCFLVCVVFFYCSMRIDAYFIASCVCECKSTLDFSLCL